MRNITPVPNILFDKFIPLLTESELKILLVIIRQTYGWHNPKTGSRKVKDRISHSQFISKTGLSRRTITKAIKGLVDKGLVAVICQNGKSLSIQDRRGSSSLYYMCTFMPQHVHLTTPTCANSAHNKRKGWEDDVYWATTKQVFKP